MRDIHNFLLEREDLTNTHSDKHHGYRTFYRDGKIVAKVPYDRGNNYFSKSHVLSQLRKTAPDLLDAYRGVNGTDTDERTEVATLHKKRLQSAIDPITEALITRIEVAMSDNDFKTRAAFVDWCMMVGEDAGLKIWASKAAGAQAIKQIVNRQVRMPAEWMFTLINRAIDEAYGVSASRQVDGASTAPKPITAARETEPPPPISPGLHKGGKEAPPVAPAPTPEKPKSADAIAELRERYIETLMEGVKAGNSDAMDRIEKIIGLK